MKRKRIRLEVCPQSKRGGRPWKLTKDSITYAEFNTQRDTIAAAVTLAKQLEARGEWITLKIKRPNGEIRDECTYPRSSDPRGTKG